ncbi:hypothetical protein GCM10011415_33900 [Salipiger pallidus]|uniref:Sulfotransferase family protein n=2 Tax=Salipiger pallidus TaxID=1775170 RepID=A0A8J2ZMW2_9RHOB|nr:sulfotransferase family 2 domain-containing protein [Salipiger pallidus]GGG81538.1 hypothetical protein GCM10011415_33900 [Salipiger pallidus]
MVLVCHDNRFVFLKTRKTAGTSAEMFLQSYCAGQPETPDERTHAQVTPHCIVGRRRIPAEEQTDLDRTWYNHMSATEIRTLLGPDQWPDYMKITTVRNPFAIAVSQFYFRLRTRNLTLPDHPEAHVTAFRKAVKKDKYYSCENIVYDQGEFAPRMIVRCEYMQEDLARVCEALDLSFEADRLPVTKRTGDMRLGLSVADFYDRASTARIHDIFAWMFDKAGYPDTPVGETNP